MKLKTAEKELRLIEKKAKRTKRLDNLKHRIEILRQAAEKIDE